MNTRIAIAGAGGRMGHALVEATLASGDLTLAGALAVEGNETRCWVTLDPTPPGSLRAQAMPDDVVAKFKAIAA